MSRIFAELSGEFSIGYGSTSNYYNALVDVWGRYFKKNIKERLNKEINKPPTRA